MPRPLMPPNPDEPALVITNVDGREAPYGVQFWLVQFGRRQEITGQEVIGRYFDAGRVLQFAEAMPPLLELMPIVEQRRIFGRAIVSNSLLESIEMAQARIVKGAQKEAGFYNLQLAEMTWEIRKLDDTQQTEITLRCFAR